MENSTTIWTIGQNRAYVSKHLDPSLLYAGQPIPSFPLPTDVTLSYRPGREHVSFYAVGHNELA